MDYFFYNTDNTDGTLIGAECRFRILIQEGFAATSGPIRFGEQLGKLSKGNTLLMYENKIGVVAIGTVLKPWDGKSHKPPLYYLGRFGHEYRIKVDWFLDLSDKPITLGDLRQRIGSARFTPRGAVNRIKKWRVEIEKMIDERHGTVLAQSALIEDLELIERRKIDSTTKDALVIARVGQGRFRTQVLQLWENCCSVTRSVTHDAIRASHIKPWRESTDEERLDPKNGLPLIASLDALFDAGLISFETSGEMIVSSKLNAAERQIFGIGDESLAKKPPAKTADYLAYHRKEVFRK